ncbi:MAG: M20 metallopeptidase family protein [Oscillospiraceae bacterium]
MNEAFHTSLHTAMKARAAEILPEVIELRRTIHKHPETGFDTGETEKLVNTFLEREHIAILPSELGVLGLIRGQNHDRIVALRADMDALPLQEETGLPYCSQVPGKMHACGHDGHTAMLLGTAKILQEYADELPTDILLIFQPAEEGPGLGGAVKMVPQIQNTGLADKIVAAFGQHVSNDYPAGFVALKKGPVAASTDSFDITFIGKGGHAGRPNECIDALSAGAKFVTAMESFMSRHTDPFDPCVCSTGIFQAGTAKGIVAESAHLAGTIRCQKEETRTYIIDNLKRVAQGVAYATGTECDIQVKRGVLGLRNDNDMVDYARSVMDHVVGKDHQIELPHPMMGAEDFSYYAKEFPAAFYWLGTRNEQRAAPHCCTTRTLILTKASCRPAWNFSAHWQSI